MPSEYIRRMKAVSEAKRCRDVYRYYPRGLETIDLTASLEASKDTPLPPPSFRPLASTDSTLTAFAQLTTIRLKASRCLISLIDSQHQYVLAESGPSFTIRDTHTEVNLKELWLGNVTIPRRRGVCDQVIRHVYRHVYEPTSSGESAEVLVINDLLEHEQYSSVNYVSGAPGWRFYAGTPLCSPEGSPIGVLCVYDEKPRNEGLDTEAIGFLQDMATTIMKLLIAQKAQHDNQRGEQMVRGLTDFLEGATSLQAAPSRPTQSFEPEDHEAQLKRPHLGPGVFSDDDVPTLNAWSPASVAARALKNDISIKRGPIDVNSVKDKPAKTSMATKDSESESHDALTSAETRAHLQDSLLPAKAKAMFARAANIMRQTSDLDGVVFFDASIAAVGSKTTGNSLAASILSQDGGLRSANPPMSNSPSTSTTDITESSDSSSWGKSEKRTCQILGFSGMENSSVAGHTAGLSMSSMPEKILKRLLKRYPAGKVINFGTDGEAATSSDDLTHTEASSEDDKAPPPKLRISKQGVRTRRVIDALKAVAPDARSICILPLWDYERSRWFSCCVLWTTQPDRLLSANVDLIYLKAFGNSVMTELARLDEATNNKVKTTFVASISHELRSPLHGILGGIEFLQNTNLDAFQSAMVHSITTCGRTLLDVINHVLDFTKMNDFQLNTGSVMQIRDHNTIQVSSRSRGRTTLPNLAGFQMVSNLRAVTEEVVESVFASQSYRISHDRMEDEDNNRSYGAVLGEPRKDSPAPVSETKRKIVLVILDIANQANTQLKLPVGAWRRILMNIFGNALKYTETGFIKIVVRVSDTGSRLDSRNSRVTLTVSDTGIGMSRDFLVNRIFSPFTQENTFSSGVGLGLNLLRQIVDSLHGTIKVKSILGEGTEISVAIDVPNNDHAIAPIGHEDSLVEIRKRIQGKKVCVLHKADNNPRLPTLGEFESKGVKLFGDAICHTLNQWLGITPVVTNDWVGQEADIVILTEPSFESLNLIRSQTPAGQRPPITLMLAVDVVEAASLRNDARVLSTESVVTVMAQPCGPFKLAKILDHCLDRYEEPLAATMDNLALLSFKPKVLHTAFVPSVDISPAPYDSPEYGKLGHVVPPKSSYTVLIADDNSINRRLLIALINKHNMRYLEAVDGLQALQLYKKHHESINVVLMDISMPVLDGMTSTRRIRAFEGKEKLEKTVIIALTGLVSASARLEALESGVDEFMTKPVNFGKLIGMMPGLMEDDGKEKKKDGEKEPVVEKDKEKEKECEKGNAVDKSHTEELQVTNGVVTPPNSDRSGSTADMSTACV